VIAGAGYFRSLRCGSCHDLIIGTPKPGPTLGLEGIQHPREWLLQHFSDPSQTRGDTGEVSLSVPQRNALLVFVASLNPSSLQTVTGMSPAFISGAQTYVASACASCHKVNGFGGDIGPSLNGLANRRSESWVRAHFLSPRKLSPRSIMPPYYFTGTQEDDLIGYLFSLSE
jgi:ubiquinol-cytochrome c reductase cytochrome b subunit